MVDLPFEFNIVNQDNSKPGVTYSDYTLEKYFDKYGSLSMSCHPNVAISENAQVEATYNGSLKFRGYIDYPELTPNGDVSFTAYEQQRLLEFRTLQLYNYPANTTVSEMLSDAVPSNVCGLLFFANSLIPQGAFVQYSGNVYYIRDYLDRGGGTSSIFGTISAVYQDETLLNVGSSPVLSAGSWYQDADEFYIRTTDDKSPDHWCISVPNWKDTNLRIGNIDVVIASETFSVPWRTSKTNVDQEWQRLLNAFGLEWKWRHDEDGYTYVDIKSTIGRGSSTRGVTTYKERLDPVSFQRVLTGDAKITCLVGAGAGSGLTQQTAAAGDLYSGGVWKEEIYTDSRQFEEQILQTIEKIFPDRKEGTCYIIGTGEDLNVDTGDYVDVVPYHSGKITDRVRKVSYRPGTMELEIGRRLVSPADALKAKFDLLDSFSTTTDAYLSSWVFPFQGDTLSDTVPYTVRFKVNTDEIDDEYEYRFLLNCTLGFYKACINSANTPTHSHVEGSGGGGDAGGGMTEPAGSHKHYLEETSTMTTGSVLLCNIDEEISVDIEATGVGLHNHELVGLGFGPSSNTLTVCTSASIDLTVTNGSHRHSFSATTGGATVSSNINETNIFNVTRECSYVPGTTVIDDVTFTHTSHPIALSTHGHVCPGLTGFATHNHAVNVALSTNTASASDHYHTADANCYTSFEYVNHNHSFHHDSALAWAAGADHIHTIAVVETNTVPAFQAPIPLQDPMDVTLGVWPAVSTGTGSIIYLDLSITLNNTPVDGSPFMDYYPGDSLSDIDISDLIVIGSDNVLTFEIQETSNGNSPVRCSVGGSVSARYYVSSI